MSNPRIAKLADQIKLVVAEYLAHKIKDPRLGFITVTDVRLTADAREATVFYTVLGGESELADTAVALESARGVLRAAVAKKLGMKFAPTLAFVPDATGQAAQDMAELLARVSAEDERKAAQAAGAAYAGEPDPYRVDNPEE